MTVGFLIVLRILLLGLVGYWAYCLWTGTTSWTSRGVGGLFIATLAWRIISGTG